VKKSGRRSIHISIAKQRLSLKRGRSTERTFPVSTSKFGLGMEEGSMKTPLGRFRVAEKIGDGMPIETAYMSREPIHATAKILRAEDLVMSRILWLDGLEPRNANSYSRYIYIHGTNHEDQIGQPASHGCIRMKNADVAELFNLVNVDTRVVIAAPRAKAPNARKTRNPLPRRNDPPK
jgi:lipoprotein-anchoring transpeptidase ErfK/SrfK